MATKDTRWQLPIVQFATLVVVMMLVFAVGSFAKTMLDNYRLSDERAHWTALRDEEKAKYERLTAERERVAAESYQRRLAHEMGLYAPDERPLTLVLPAGAQREADDFAPVYREATPYEPPYWQQWWELFFGES